MTNQELATALRCSSTVHQEDVHCEGCPFYAKEDLPEDMKGKYPEDFFSMCDVDRIALMAADALSNSETHVLALQREIEKLRGQLEFSRGEQKTLAEALCKQAVDEILVSGGVSGKDTGLTPERCAELAKADKDGRLVVLPCKVGDTVFVNGTKRIVQATIDEAYLDDAKGVEYLVSFTCDTDCNGCPFNDWKQEYSGEYSCEGEWGNASIMGADFGKTVFLTREEAEAAMKEARNDD